MNAFFFFWFVLENTSGENLPLWLKLKIQKLF